LTVEEIGGGVADHLKIGHAHFTDYLGIGTEHLQTWRPAHYVGTYDAGTTYIYGDAVRANDSGTWKLYVSIVGSNLAHNPVGDSDVHWFDIVNSARPIVAEGTANPNLVGEQTRITHYTQNATGGTFALGSAATIAWDALEAAIQAALVNEYTDGGPVVTGDAADFTVEYNFADLSSLDLDDANLTGGGLTLQADTQAQIVGGFVSSGASLYISQDSSQPALYTYDYSASRWQARQHFTLDSSGNHPFDERLTIVRQGGLGNARSIMTIDRTDGDGDATRTLSATRDGTGTGSARIQEQVTVGGTVVGDPTVALFATLNETAVGGAQANLESQVNDSAVGTAITSLESSVQDSAVGTAETHMLSSHHDSPGQVWVHTFADTTGLYVGFGLLANFGNSGKGHKLGDLTLAVADITTVVDEFNALRQALVDAGFAVAV
jgi:hypothetical protein